MKDVLSRANLEGGFCFETYHRKLQYSLIYEAQPKTRSKIYDFKNSREHTTA